MSGSLDGDDLAALATGFRAAMTDAPDPAAAQAALVELGWPDLLAAAPAQGAAMAFATLGATGSAAGLIDDVVLQGLGLDVSPDRCVVLPAPGRADPPARGRGASWVVDGVVSARADTATTVIVVGDIVASFDAGELAAPEADALDPGRAYRRVRVELDRAQADRGPDGDGGAGGVADPAAWPAAVAAARVALAHQLIGLSRTMLEQARAHALDRVQFGRPISSFQAVRHRLAEALVAIEGAEAAAEVWDDGVDPLVAMVAKSLAGRAARTTAGHAQQVLAGIGFTTDHPFHRWMRRALVVDTLFGSASSLPAEIGYELLARGTSPRLVEL